MRWLLVSLWLLGAALYAAIAFTSSDSDRAAPTQSAAEVPQKDASRIVSEAGANAYAPATQAVTNDAGQAQTTTSQFPNRETSSTLPNELAPVNTAKQHPWGQMLRGAPVHSGPDVSSAVLGYAAADTEMQILERDLGWVKVLDPETARQGWIYEKHVAARPGIETGTVQETALADDAELGASEKPARTFKSQKSRKKHFSKKRRYYGEHRRRRVLGFFPFRRF
jgi:Bacterial SH3 domain